MLTEKYSPDAKDHYQLHLTASKRLVSRVGVLRSRAKIVQQRTIDWTD